MTTYSIAIGKSKFTAATLADASSEYSARRDRSGRGQRTFPDGAVTLDGKHVARISYNGRVWANAEWSPNDVLIYDNRPAARAAS